MTAAQPPGGILGALMGARGQSSLPKALYGFVAGSALPREKYVELRAEHPLTANERKQLAEIRTGMLRLLGHATALTPDEADELSWTVAALWRSCNCERMGPIGAHYEPVTQEQYKADLLERLDEIRRRERD